MDLMNLDSVDQYMNQVLSEDLKPRELQNRFNQLILKADDKYSKFEELDQLLRQYLHKLESDNIARCYLTSTIATNLVHHSSFWNVRHGAYMPKLKAVQDLTHLCQQEKEISNNPYSDVFLGVAHHLVGEDSKSYEYFCAVAENPKTRQFIFDDKLGCFTAKPWSVSQIINYFQEDVINPPLTWEIEGNSKPGQFVVSFFCDDVYFQAFSPYIIKSLKEVYTEGEFCIHFHVINLGEKSKQLAQQLLNELSQISVELFLSSEQTEVKDRAYFTVSRFLKAESLIQYFDKDVIILDADCDILVSPVEIWNHFRQFEVGGLFCKGPWGYIPWRVYWAGFTYFSKKRGGIEFTKLMKQVINYLWSHDRGNWWVDQNALYMTMRLMHIFYPDLKFCDMGGGLATSFVNSSEEIKLSRLSSVNQFKNGLNQGKHWAAILAELQLS
jgi:hypothetical protein